MVKRPCQNILGQTSRDGFVTIKRVYLYGFDIIIHTEQQLSIFDLGFFPNGNFTRHPWRLRGLMFRESACLQTLGVIIATYDQCILLCATLESMFISCFSCVKAQNSQSMIVFQKKPPKDSNATFFF